MDQRGGGGCLVQYTAVRVALTPPPDTPQAMLERFDGAVRPPTAEPPRLRRARLRPRRAPRPPQGLLSAARKSLLGFVPAGEGEE